MEDFPATAIDSQKCISGLRAQHITIISRRQTSLPQQLLYFFSHADLFTSHAGVRHASPFQQAHPSQRETRAENGMMTGTSSEPDQVKHTSMNPPPKLTPQPPKSPHAQPNIYGIGGPGAQPPPYSGVQNGPTAPTESTVVPISTVSRTTEGSQRKHWGYFCFGVLFGWVFTFFAFLGLCCIDFPRPKRFYASGSAVGLIIALIMYTIIGLVVGNNQKLS